MNNASKNNGRESRTARVIEIIGPAGAGKTTLCQMLVRHTEIVRLENFPDVRKATDAPFFILNGLQLIPGLIRIYHPNSRQLTRREFAWMSILNGWSAILRRETNDGDKVIILDQGPLYLFAEMRVFGPEYLRQNSAERFWQNLYDRWMTTLSMVVYLDATDEVLFDRIRSRQQEHIVKTEPSTVVYKFLDRYRAEYAYLLSIFTANMGNLKVLRCDSGKQSLQDIANQLLAEVN